MAVNHQPVERHYTIDEVGQILGGVSRSTVDRYRSTGELSPWIALRGRVIFPASTINRFLKSRRIG